MARESSFTSRRIRLPGSIQELVPAVGALIAIVTVMTIINHKFLLPSNITNLLLQQAEPATLAIGLVMILLLGEIDLSVGAVSGFCAGIMASLSVRHGVNPIISIALAISAGAFVGLFQSLWVVLFEIPAFIVTLAGLIAWQGGLFAVLGSQGTIGLTDPKIEFLTQAFLSNFVAWIFFTVLVFGFCLSRAISYIKSKKLEISGPSLRVVISQSIIFTLIVLIFLLYFQRDRGFPVSFFIALSLAIWLHLISKYTRFGRNVYAIGGSSEAARRAGVPVKRIRVQVFMIATACAGLAGILGSSRLSAVGSGQGGGTLLLNAIAAVVIGGTSLFGGRGHIWSALIGTLIIGAISNGMDLLALASPVKYGVTASVLLAAVTFDSISRKRSSKKTT
jgi:D-xylose transport system permease protein